MPQALSPDFVDALQAWFGSQTDLQSGVVQPFRREVAEATRRMDAGEPVQPYPPVAQSGNAPVGDIIALMSGSPRAGEIATTARNAARGTARALSGVAGAERGGENLAEAIETGDPVRGALATGQIGLSALSPLFMGSQVVGKGGQALRGALDAPFATRGSSALTYGGMMGVPALAGSELTPTAGASKKKGAAPTVNLTPPDGLSAGDQKRWLELQTKKEAQGYLDRTDRDSLKSLEDTAASIKRKQGELSAEGESTKVKEAGAARKKVLDEARRPFESWAPNWASWQHAIPIGLGLGTGLLIGGRGAMADRGAAKRWWEAVNTATSKTASAEDKAAAVGLARQYAKDWPKPMSPLEAVRQGRMPEGAAPYVTPAVLGAGEGAATANMPEIYNSFLPSENPERTAMLEYIKLLPEGHPEQVRAKKELADIPPENPARKAAFEHFFESTRGLKRAGVGAFEGGSSALLGTTLGKLYGPKDRNLPRSETADIVRRYEQSPEYRRELFEAARSEQARKAAQSGASLADEVRLQGTSGPVPVGPGGLASTQATLGQTSAGTAAAGASIQSQPSASSLLGTAAAKRGPSQEQYSGARAAVYEQLKANTPERNLSVAEAKRWMQANKIAPPSDSVIQRHIREAREVMREVKKDFPGLTGANLLRAYQARISQYKNMISPLAIAAGGAEAARQYSGDEATAY